MADELEWLGLAGWVLRQEDGPDIAMDPYEPEIVANACDVGIEVFDYRTSADTVLVSSLTDRAHSFARAVKGHTEVVNTLDIARGNSSYEVSGQPVYAVRAAEAPHHPEGPDDNALYCFNAGGLWYLHMGDVGYGLETEELAPFAGRCDVLFAVVGENLTLPLYELEPMIELLQPTWILPMHYNLPPLSAGMVKLSAFLEKRSRDPVVHVRSSRVELPLPRLSQERPTIVVLEPSGYEPSELN